MKDRFGVRSHTSHSLTITEMMQGSGDTGWYFGTDLAWQTRAACGKAAEPEQFFPEGGRPSNRGKKKFCAGCPVREQCLDWALVHEEQGIWGGLTEKERERLVLSRLPLPFNRETK